jgi:hypothetical protein|tara:strand:+ start:1587 stop:2180 length:594 start_codon:yes stop_codon:yes gene_type:complete
MGKLTWQHLGWVYEDQFGISPEEAAEILTKHIFTDTTWKGTHKNPIGRMWKDHANIYAFFTLLDKLKKLKKSDGKNASRKLFYESGEFLYFIQTAGLIYKRSPKGLKKFQNDFGLWTKHVPLFKGKFKGRARWKHDKINKKIRKQVNKFEKIREARIKTENVSREKGLKNRDQLIRSGEYKEVKNIYGNINLKRVIK